MYDAANVLLSIGGEQREAIGGLRYTHINPLTGEPATNAAAAGIEDAKAAADAAGTAFPAWAAIGPHARRALLSKAASVLESSPTSLSRR